MSGSSTVRKETTFIKSLQVYAEIFSTGVRHQQITVRPTLILVSSSCTIPLPLARNQNKGGSASCCNPSRFPPKDHPRTKPPVTEKIFFPKKVNIDSKKFTFCYDERRNLVSVKTQKKLTINAAFGFVNSSLRRSGFCRSHLIP